MASETAPSAQQDDHIQRTGNNASVHAAQIASQTVANRPPQAPASHFQVIKNNLVEKGKHIRVVLNRTLPDSSSYTFVKTLWFPFSGDSGHRMKLFLGQAGNLIYWAYLRLHKIRPDEVVLTCEPMGGKPTVIQSLEGTEGRLIAPFSTIISKGNGSSRKHLNDFIRFVYRQSGQVDREFSPASFGSLEIALKTIHKEYPGGSMRIPTLPRPNFKYSAPAPQNGNRLVGAGAIQGPLAQTSAANSAPVPTPQNIAQDMQPPPLPRPQSRTGNTTADQHRASETPPLVIDSIEQDVTRSVSRLSLTPLPELGVPERTKMREVIYLCQVDDKEAKDKKRKLKALEDAHSAEEEVAYFEQELREARERAVKTQKISKEVVDRIDRRKQEFQARRNQVLEGWTLGETYEYHRKRVAMDASTDKEVEEG